jgi:hypothetical protein
VSATTLGMILENDNRTTGTSHHWPVASWRHGRGSGESSSSERCVLEVGKFNGANRYGVLGRHRLNPRFECVTSGSVAARWHQYAQP